MTDTLTAFIRARLDEDEEVAQAAATVAAPPWEWKQQLGPHKYGLVGRHPVQPQTDEWVVPSAWPDVYPHRDTADHIARHDPARVLAQVAAMRAIVDEYESKHRNRRDHPDDLASAGALLALHGVVKRLAAIWRDHDDYDPAWAPEGE